MNGGDAADVQIVLSYFLDPDGQIEDAPAMAATLRLAERAYKKRAGLHPNDVAAMFRELLEAVDEVDLDARPIEDVPVGDVL
jgi:hypothetical protein